MKYPGLKEEKKLWKKGYKCVVGLDEAGRGPLAGPVVAAAVTILKPSISKLQFSELKDSKRLSLKKREKFYNLLIKHPSIKWGVGKASEKVVDKINILEATKLAMEKAVEKIRSKNRILKIDYLILDGNFKLNSSLFPQKSIVKADEKVFSCAAASIIAKVTRDKLMQRYHKKYFQYRFDKHKGYPTKFHFKALKKYGPCKIHRKTFKPVTTCNAK